MIKRTKSILLLIVILAASISAQPVEQLMKEGNEFYKSANWESAIDSYNKILNQGFESAALYYNLGNAYFKIGQLGEAILNYERGLKLEPGDEDIQFNLRLANARTVDRIQEVPKLFITEWWDLFISAFNVSGWSLIVIIFFIVFLFFIGFYFITGSINLQRISVYGSIASGISLLILVIVLFFAYNREASADYGIILSDTVNVKVSPNEESNDSFVVHEGLKFEIQDQLDNWVKIKLADGKVGWVPADAFGKI
jgi:tetratricopeptide (TPR) repeat protein